MPAKGIKNGGKKAKKEVPRETSEAVYTNASGNEID